MDVKNFYNLVHFLQCKHKIGLYGDFKAFEIIRGVKKCSSWDKFIVPLQIGPGRGQYKILAARE